MCTASRACWPSDFEVALLVRPDGATTGVKVEPEPNYAGNARVRCHVGIWSGRTPKVVSLKHAGIVSLQGQCEHAKILKETMFVTPGIPTRFD
jgi:hypothetical protein